MVFFQDRTDAGRKLAQKMTSYKGKEHILVLGLPRGGIPVAYEVARELKAPLDVFLVRKLGVPGREELAMGAIASGGVRVLNQDVINALGIPEAVIKAAAEREQKELERREQVYRGNRPRVEVRGKTVILIDDGLATGSSMLAAVASLRTQNPAQIVVAVPIAPLETCERIEREVDAILCLETPEPFYRVGLWYENFAQTTDEEVRGLLERTWQPAR